MQAQVQSEAAIGISWAHFRVPPFPQVALRVLECVDDDGMSMCRLIDLISSDPAFCTEVLIIANSPMIASRFPVTSILQAVALLGTSRIKGLCLTVGVRAYLGKSLSYPTLQAIWRHSLASAVIAEQLIRAGLMEHGDAYTAGLLHEIGRFALAVLLPKEYSALLETHTGSPKSILSQERRMFGLDHCEIGQQLVEEWKLPVEFDAVVRQKKTARWNDDPWHMADVIHLACRMADTAGFPAFPGCEVTPYEELLGELSPQQRHRFYADIDTLSRDLVTRLKAIESL